LNALIEMDRTKSKTHDIVCVLEKERF